jgi:acetyl-CoA carboxylase biotin carboxyl carrier protein
MATKKAKKASTAAVKKAATKKTAAKKTTSERPKPPAKGLMADVQNLMEMMSAHDVTEIDIKDGVRKIALKRGGLVASVMPASMATPMSVMAPPAAPAPAEAKAPAPADDLIEITSPMVGTFYAAASPDSEPYAEVGARINTETVVCIVEAMKVMNEIKAEVSGTIAEVCVKNAEPVEFGQVMFRVKP